MSILCGVDFSPASLEAANAAARLAVRWGTSLQLAHVVDVAENAVYGKLREEVLASSKAALGREAERLRAEGVRVDVHVVEGKPDVVLARLAGEVRARAIIVSATSSRSDAREVGGSADRITMASTLPVLVVRDPAPFTAWLDGQRPLKVVLAVDRTRVSAEAIRFLAELRKAGPCDVDALHLYWPMDEYRRLGLSGLRSIIDTNPEVERVLERDLAAELQGLQGEGSLSLHIEAGLGRPSDRIVAFAESAGADLLLVGSHRRNLLDRMWNGSTSRAILHSTQMSVALVTEAVGAEERPLPKVASVLVATDFSDTGDAAIGWAYGVLPRGGVVHLVNVQPPSGPTTVEPRDIFDPPVRPEDVLAQQEALRQLKNREPAAGREGGITTKAHVLTAKSPSAAIVQAAERLGVDIIVMGTQGKGTLKRVVLGSVAQQVMERFERPVMLIHPPAARGR